MSTIPYLVGFLLIVTACAWAAYLLGVPSRWIGVMIVFLLGLGILRISKQHRRDLTR